MVNVTHDGNDWRTLLERLFAALVLTELQVEGLEQLTVLVFWGDDLDVVVNLSPQQLQGFLGNGGGCGNHLTEVKQSLYQCCWICTNLLSEVSQRCTSAQTYGLALAVRQTYATYLMLLLLFELMTLLTLGLLAPAWCATWTAECTSGAAATTAATATTEATRAALAWSTLATPTAATATAATVGGLGRHGCRVRMRRHHGRRWTTAAALSLALTLVAFTLAGASAALATTVIAWLAARTWALGTARSRSWTVATGTASGERVVGHAAGAAWLRHRTRHGVTRSRALATRLRC